MANKEENIPDYARVDGYAKVGGPPSDWSKYDVVDMDTGKEVKDVIEVDCKAGWLRRYETSVRGDRRVERVEGNFRLKKMKVTKVELR